MIGQDLKKHNLPDHPGVYYFRKGRKILYVGKATSLKDRVKSYFANDLMLTRGSRVVSMIVDADKVTFQTTDSVLEALILEAAEIKKHQPFYNIKEKDDKSFNYVVITKEDFPRILIERGRNLEFKKYKAYFGPFVYGSQLKEALKIIRKTFPFRDRCELNQKRGCFNYQIGLCPGVCIGVISKTEYAKTIRNIILFFSGKKKKLISVLKKEMMKYAKERNFERAEKIKRQIFALEHIHDVSLLKGIDERENPESVFRIEAYDIAHISGTNTVGVMTVIENGEVKKSDYRKFKIHGANKNSVNDVANLKEVLVRRLGHAEWPLPNLIVVDGSTAQINAAKAVLKERGFNIDIGAVVKDERHKAREIIAEKRIVERWGKGILLANSEAHRFAITYHRKLRNKLG